MVSNIAAVTRPKWQILGTKGSIEAKSENEISLVSYASGIRQESNKNITVFKNSWSNYYRNIADHLLLGEELICKPEEGRRLIGVIDAAQKSSEIGRSLVPFEGCE